MSNATADSEVGSDKDTMPGGAPPAGSSPDVAPGVLTGEGVTPPEPPADELVGKGGEGDEDHDVPSGVQKRINDIYGKMKAMERRLNSAEITGKEKDEAIKKLSVWNDALQASLDNVEDHFDASNRPDPTEDPEGFAKYVEAKVTRDMGRKQENGSKGILPEATAPAPMDSDLKIQIQIQEGLHPDYNDMMEMIKPDLDRDSVLRNEIWGASNPPAAAYMYAQRRKGQAGDDRSATLGQGYVEGGGHPPAGGGKPKLSSEEERMALKLGIKPEAYLKQKEEIDKIKTTGRP